MVDLIYGRSINEIIHEIPLYISLVRKYLGIRLFNEKHAIFGSADIVNVCNLHCKHCYWYLNREDSRELNADEWRAIIKSVFKKNKVFNVTLVGGEPLLRPDIIKVFCEEMPRQICVVTNGTYPLQPFEGLYFYWISIDGNKEVHDNIRGKGSYDKTYNNIMNYMNGPKRNGKDRWHDIWISYTINSLNYNVIEEVVDEWYDKVNKIAFQFYTPFMRNDPLALRFGKDRDLTIETIIKLKDKYKNFIINTKKHLLLLRSNWGGVGTTPVQCPTYAIISLDHLGRIKEPCCIGGKDINNKPLCDECGLGCYSILITQGIRA